MFYPVQSLPEDIKATGQSAVDQVRGAAQPYTGTVGNKGISGPGSVSGVALP